MSNPDTIKRLALAYDELAQALLATIDDGVSSTAPVPQQAPVPQGAEQAAFPGNCPVHNKPFTTVKADGTPAKRAFCKTKVGDGWCDQKGPWLQPKS